MEIIKNFNLFTRNNKEIKDISYPNKSFKEKYKGHTYKWEDYEGGFDSVQSFLHKLTVDTLGKGWGKKFIKESNEIDPFGDFKWDDDEDIKLTEQEEDALGILNSELVVPKWSTKNRLSN